MMSEIRREGGVYEIRTSLIRVTKQSKERASTPESCHGERPQINERILVSLEFPNFCTQSA